MHIYILFFSSNIIIDNDKDREMMCYIINEKATFQLRVSTVSKNIIYQGRCATCYSRW